MIKLEEKYLIRDPAQSLLPRRSDFQTYEGTNEFQVKAPLVHQTLPGEHALNDRLPMAHHMDVLWKKSKISPVNTVAATSALYWRNDSDLKQVRLFAK